jgi:hypothetical protein
MCNESFESTPAFTQMHTELSNTFPQQNVYSVPLNSSNVFHFTIMQVIGFPQYDEQKGFFEAHKDQYLCRLYIYAYKNIYKAVFEEVLTSLLPFKITYRGLMAVRTGLCVAGYPSVDVNGFRKTIEQKLKEKGLLYREYQNNIVHSTILRIQKPMNGQELVNFASKYEDTYLCIDIAFWRLQPRYFGTLTVTEFHLAHSSWRMQTEEVVPVATFERKI